MPLYACVVFCANVLIPVSLQDLEIQELRQRLQSERGVRKACEKWLKAELKSRVSRTSCWTTHWCFSAAIGGKCSVYFV